tara:strand:- start:5978 stop:6571 length:594 start_codon:yes stop_codon:yes gene_type:complete
MKITKSQLVKIIKEELQAVQEQMPPENALDAFGQSLSGGSATIDGEEKALDRLEEPETQAILDIIGYLKDPTSIPVSTGSGAPEGKDLVDQYVKLNKMTGEKAEKTYAEVMNVLSQIAEPFRNLKQGVDVGDTPWPSFTQALYMLRKRAEGSQLALGLADNVIQTIINRVETAGDAGKGNYGVGGSMGLKNIEGGLS